MGQEALLLDLSEVKLVSLGRPGGAIKMDLLACPFSSACPNMWQDLARVHSRLRRKRRDLP